MICPGVQQNQAQGTLTRQFLAEAAGHSHGSASSIISPGCQDFPAPLPTTALAGSREDFSLHQGGTIFTWVFRPLILSKNTSCPLTVCKTQGQGRALQKADRVNIFTGNHFTIPTDFSEN